MREYVQEGRLAVADSGVHEQTAGRCQLLGGFVRKRLSRDDVLRLRKGGDTTLTVECAVSQQIEYLDGGRRSKRPLVLQWIEIAKELQRVRIGRRGLRRGKCLAEVAERVHADRHDRSVRSMVRADIGSGTGPVMKKVFSRRPGFCMRMAEM